MTQLLEPSSKATRPAHHFLGSQGTEGSSPGLHALCVHIRSRCAGLDLAILRCETHAASAAFVTSSGDLLGQMARDKVKHDVLVKALY